jgi:uncharacterized membrane protein YdbT with pleckstrin-like domain
MVMNDGDLQVGYIDKNLMAEEEIVYTAKIHWFIYLPPLFWLVVGVLLVLVKPNAVELRDLEPYLAPLGIVLIVYAAIRFIGAWITRWTTELGITTKRVIAKFGLIRRDTVELNHSKVESFIVVQSILGRIFDFGTLVIQGTGGGQTPIQGVDSPLTFRREAMQVIDKTCR